MKLLLYGNCQINVLGEFLSKLYPEHSVITLKQVQQISNKNYFLEKHSVIKKADVIILQNVGDPDRDPFLQILNVNDKSTIFIDSLYASFEHPELIHIANVKGFKIGQLHDKEIIHAMASNIEASCFLKNDPFYEGGYYPESLYENEKNITILEIKKRQNFLFQKIKKYELSNYSHIDITEYIKNIGEATEHAEMLWDDLNHPSISIFKYLIIRIAKILDIGYPRENTWNTLHQNRLMSIYRPPYQSTIKKYGFKNVDRNYHLGDSYKNVTRKDYVADSFAFYKSFSKEHYQQLTDVSPCD